MHWTTKAGCNRLPRERLRAILRRNHKGMPVFFGGFAGVTGFSVRFTFCLPRTRLDGATRGADVAAGAGSGSRLLLADEPTPVDDPSGT